MIPTKSQPLYLQVEEFIRKQITAGEIRVNDKLPPTDELAVITGTSVCTVQKALSKLCREGLLDRKTGRGTYIKGDKATLTCAGLYFNRPFSLAGSTFYQLIGQDLRQKLGERGVKVRVWMDEREEDEQGSPVASLRQAIDKREIQALIAPLVSLKDLAWLQASSVPVGILTTDSTIKNGVNTDFKDVLRLGLEELRRQGCRTVGVINNIPAEDKDVSSSGIDYYDSLDKIIAELGLKSRDEWIRYPERYTPHLAHFGHEQFHALWDLPERPDGVLGHPDALAIGMITAILERRLNVPQDVKLVLHANDRMPYVCPFQATFLRAEVGRYADALIQMVCDQLEGHEAHPIQVPITVIREGDPFPKQ